jgi:G3E family GTPase
VLRAERANVPLGQVLGRAAFDIERIVSLEPDFLQGGEDGHVHDEHCGHGHDHHQHGHEHHDHQHDDAIASISLRSDQPMDGQRIGDWLNALVASKGADLLRSKGIIDVAGDDRRLVFQSVHMLLEGDYQRPWKPGEARFSRLVFIGRDLDRGLLEAGFRRCVA